MDLEILGCPDSSFGFFCNISGKTQMNFLGQANRITKLLSHQNINNDSLLSNTYSHVSNNYLLFCSLIVQTLRSISWVSFNPWVLPLFLILFIENYLWKKLSYLTYNVSQRWKLDWLHPYSVIQHVLPSSILPLYWSLDLEIWLPLAFFYPSKTTSYVLPSEDT